MVGGRWGGVGGSGLTADAAMHGVVVKSVNGVRKRKYASLYDSMLVTPISPSDIATGEIS